MTLKKGGGRESGAVLSAKSLGKHSAIRRRNTAALGSSDPDDVARRGAAAIPAASSLAHLTKAEIERILTKRIRELEAELADGYACHVANHAMLEDRAENAEAREREEG